MLKFNFNFLHQIYERILDFRANAIDRNAEEQRESR